MQAPSKIAIAWPEAIHAQFKRAGIAQVGYVPDAGHGRLIELCIADAEICETALTTEEEGVALAAGAMLGGQKTALLMQSSGVGNCVNMFSLLKTHAFPCLVLVSMRGEFGEWNAGQVPMGMITADVLKLCGFLVQRCEHAADVDAVVGAACDMAFGTGQPTAVLLSQRLADAWEAR